jgi:hypothetical protein
MSLNEQYAFIYREVRNEMFESAKIFTLEVIRINRFIMMEIIRMTLRLNLLILKK